MNSHILIIDDDVHFSSLLATHLRSKGLEVLLAQTGEEGLQVLRKHPDIDLIFLDVMLPDGFGVDQVGALKSICEEVPIMMVSTSGDAKNVVAAMKAGASDYLQKPIQAQEIWSKIHPLLNMHQAQSTEKEIRGSEAKIIGESLPIRQLIRDISKIACSDASVLMRGESGTGKSLVAEVIHAHSPRRARPFLTINCPAIPENLLESELFGHEKGAFTGAIREKPGKFELAEGGTVFLDEIGDLSLEMQVKLLRVIQNHEFERVGGLQTLKADIRIIAATNRNLEEAIQARRFREDLFYRLNVLPLIIPPLRERKEDIPLLAEHFFQYYSRKAGKSFESPSAELLQYLSEYDWPGNIRELQNVLERAVILSPGPSLKFSDFIIPPRSNPHSGKISDSLSLQGMEEKHFIQVLQQSQGNITQASRLLGVSRGAVYRRLHKYKVALKRKSLDFH